MGWGCVGGFPNGLCATDGDGPRLGAGDPDGVPKRDVLPEGAPKGFPAEDGLLPKGLFVGAAPKGFATGVPKGFGFDAGAPKGF